MSDKKSVRLNKLVKEFNVSIDRIYSFLEAKGIEDLKPNTKVSNDIYMDLLGEFDSEKKAKFSAELLSKENELAKAEEIIKQQEAEEKAQKEAEEKKKVELELKVKKEAAVAEQEKAKEQTQNLSEKERKVLEKLKSFQELYDSNQKMLTFGRKTNELLHKYFQTNNKKELFAAFHKWVLIEKTKHTKATASQEKTPKKNPLKKTKNELKKEKEKKQSLQKIEKEILVQVAEVRKEKARKAEKVAKEKAAYRFKVKDKVRLIDGKACGIIDKIEKNKATIDYGMFTTQANLDQIELVVAAKK